MNRQAYTARQQGRYFQIPLCAFAFGETVQERLDAIMCYGLVEVGAKQWGKLTEAQRHELLEAKTNNFPQGFDNRDLSHISAVCGAETLNLRLGPLDYILNQYDALRVFRQDFGQRHGPDPLVRLKTSLVFEARIGTGIKPSELAIIAAIFSVVGNKQGPVRITQDRIRCRAMGYKTPTVMAAELPRRTDGALPLTDWQLRSVIERLRARKFFARATYGRRLTYYSHRMTNNQLRKAVIEMKIYRFSSKLLTRLDDEAMTKAIRNHRAATAGQPPPAPDAHGLEQPRGFTPEDVF